MIRILLLRHAKSDWNSQYRNDRERPLNKRGKKASLKMGQVILERNWIPDLLLCSTATRTQETWNLVASRFPNPGTEIKLDEDLYLASSHSLEQIIGAYANMLEKNSVLEKNADFDKKNPLTLLVLAHNPGLGDLAQNWSDRVKCSTDRIGTDRNGDTFCIQHFPTAACAVFEGKVEASHFVPEKFCAFLKPGDLNTGESFGHGICS